jgi:hypothetical protein
MNSPKKNLLNSIRKGREQLTLLPPAVVVDKGVRRNETFLKS